ncbi:MAG TPA: DHHA1 domain-containing protein [Anaerolineae bacterium]|nr:DHHA1 domain-containing protein [Anaerolineae bacterium]HQH38010.1 DHHA1 domain-containing protein [Anaerolineae bacterium]
MTRRLYYDAPTMRTFEAHIVARRETDRGPAVQLDQTAFYPTSGGQPHDTGNINGIPVVDVWDEEDGTIWHLLTAMPLHDAVNGVIDWPRRFDHMQQHTGQHLLSAAFVAVVPAQTVGFHLGSDASTIDLDVPQLTWEIASQVEDEVNRIIWENRPVTIHTVTRDALDDIPLRKPPQVTGDIRVIWVEGYDASACGGTHVRATGEIGLVKITGIERYKGGSRVTFLCGERALRDYRRALHTLRETAHTLSLRQDEVPPAVVRLLDELQDARRALNKAQGQLLEFEAEHLWETAPAVDGVRRIVAHWSDHTFADARAIANLLRERPRTLLLLAVTEEKGVRLVVARSEDVPCYDAAALLRQVAAELGGRGGGSPAIAQGGTELHPPEVVLAALRQASGLEIC